MRLIDADAFEKFIKEKYKDGESTDDIKDQVLFDLSYQPTAYDVEKVVEELERMRIDESQGCHNVITVKCNGYKNCADCIFDRAIEIIRRGGVE